MSDSAFPGKGTSWRCIAAIYRRWPTRGWETNYDRFTHGDMNFDGATNLLDWFILATNHQDASSLDFAALLDRHSIPEPSGWLLAAMSLAVARMSVRRTN